MTTSCPKSCSRLTIQTATACRTTQDAPFGLSDHAIPRRGDLCECPSRRPLHHRVPPDLPTFPRSMDWSAVASTLVRLRKQAQYLFTQSINQSFNQSNEKSIHVSLYAKQMYSANVKQHKSFQPSNELYAKYLPSNMRNSLVRHWVGVSPWRME